MNKILAELEKGLYDMALLVLFVPKTLIRIIASPRWIAGYVDAEISKESTNRYEAYAPPVIFFLLLGVIPFVFACRSFVANAAPKDPSDVLLSSLNALSVESLVVGTALLLASWPVALAFTIQSFRKQPITRGSLQPLFHAQCYSWAAFVFISIYLSATLIFLRAPIWVGILPILFFYWFVYTEILLIRFQTKCSLGKAFGILAIAYLCAAAFSFIIEATLVLGTIGVPEWLIERAGENAAFFR